MKKVQRDPFPSVWDKFPEEEEPSLALRDPPSLNVKTKPDPLLEAMTLATRRQALLVEINLDILRDGESTSLP